MNIEDSEKYKVMKTRLGFIAALDQSGGSTPKTLKAYGIEENAYKTEDEMFDLINDMRVRIIKSKAFSDEHIVGVILFKKTMESKIDGEYIADYLWNKKHLLSFLKVDLGLDKLDNGVQLMKHIDGIDELLKIAVERHIFGTKMRSVIKEANEDGIKKIVAQQFEYAKKIESYGLVPIIEPEVSIDAPDKVKCEELLKKYVNEALKNLDSKTKIMFKFTLPTIPNFYQEYTKNSNVVRVVALSGGYSREKANELLSQNYGMIASFSRALLSDLRVYQSDDEFDKKLADAIISIYEASTIKK